jgi:hypothetical protein
MISLSEYICEAVELGVRTKKWLEDHGFKPCEGLMDEMIQSTHLECDRRTGETVSKMDWFIMLKNDHILVARTYGKNVEDLVEWRKNTKTYTVAKRYSPDGYAKKPQELDEIWEKYIKKLV